jgi:hypothetical protein
LKNETIVQLSTDIERMQRLAGLIMEKAVGFRAVERNTARIMASLKMLELNISDIAAVISSQQKGEATRD